jgi:hypothetical protein
MVAAAAEHTPCHARGHARLGVLAEVVVTFGDRAPAGNATRSGKTAAAGRMRCAASAGPPPARSPKTPGPAYPSPTPLPRRGHPPRKPPARRLDLGCKAGVKASATPAGHAGPYESQRRERDERPGGDGHGPACRCRDGAAGHQVSIYATITPSTPATLAAIIAASEPPASPAEPAGMAHPSNTPERGGCAIHYKRVRRECAGGSRHPAARGEGAAYPGTSVEAVWPSSGWAWSVPGG